ncbi:MAG: hypothetical protein KME49_03905 [Brasilonema octagenarum HA4186-MV1]|jgi:hypothetical protein|uniref:Uncharacterized protein n=2 Tax=Brasilonema TaxID=383614 RepID=A0A856MHR4_9CYAN|nr:MULTISPECIES: hypothetical protein [Brasilonema]MBW4624666.1 hypothetical protein [Brasilonema octagenarum HA4186-MV1]NMF65244.1 hypothetical protein [Brasilonema octagenarum UFV-OR1]QDL08516.1 hypothetical protein DP114_11975 [Brasilonema sennae CENA114]QDL14871.1 hypothetical protein DP113_11910 [Brasilonema octagenarum UFV-E1]
MYKHITKTFNKVTIGMLRHNVKDLLGVLDTKLVKKWAIEHGMGKLDMRRKYCWQMVLDAIFVATFKGDRSLCSMGYGQQESALAA